MHELSTRRLRSSNRLRRWWLPLALLTTLIFAGSQLGCGTLLYPRRRGPGSGVPDPDVVAMNVFWLCMGVWPGLIAFWVDARTGALYFPASSSRQRARPRPRSSLRPMPRPELPPPPPE